MPLIDVILIIIILGFAMFGFWFGLVHTFGSLVGTILGAVIASRFYQPVGAWLEGVTGWGENITNFIGFVILFGLISRLVGAVLWLVDKGTGFITNLPLIRSLNRFFGLVLGLIEGIVTIGLFVYFVERIPLSEWFMGHLAESAVAPFAVAFASILIPLLPEALRALRSTVEYVSRVLI